MHASTSAVDLLTHRPPGQAGLRQHGRSLRGVSVRASSTARPGEKVEKWLKTPFDIAAFGPRAAVGALVSAPERLQNLQSDLQRVSDILQDTEMPAEEKKGAVLGELEARLTDCLEKGATFEADILENIKAALPAGIADAIPKPPVLSAQEPVVEAEEVEVGIEYTSESVAAEKTSAELSGIESEVATLRENLSAMRSNLSPSRENMLKLNLREARDRLDRLLQEVSSSELSDIVSEARALLQEVDAEL